MKLLTGDGTFLEVRDVGSVVMRLEAASVPIKFHGTQVMTEDDAREALRAILEIRAVAGYKRTI